ncbi:MAG: AAA family ATPase [Xanthomonadales bacterium]|nr:AAA family ATPase [Xanthomonadales bacterium]
MGTLVERDTPLASLHQLVAALGGRHGAVALVTGEAGIGKTSLLEAFRAGIGDEADVAWGSCEALFTPRPLGPIHEMVSVLGEPVTTLLRSDTPAADIFHAILATLDKRSRPLVLIVEDVHWADRTTLDLLKFLGRRIALTPTLMVLSFRNDEIGSEHPLHQVIGDLPAAKVHRVGLQPLTRDGIADIAHPDRIDLDRLLAITSGNPFFVTEVIAALKDGDDAVPVSVKDSVNARLSRLGASERGFLEAISVIPAAFDPALVAMLFGAEGEAWAMTCVERGLLLHDNRGHLRFRHELARLATLARLSTAQEQAMHEKVLSALLDGDIGTPSVDLLVHHAAGARDAARVLELAPKAAQVAAALGSHREAAATTARHCASSTRPSRRWPRTFMKAGRTRPASLCRSTTRSSRRASARSRCGATWGGPTRSGTTCACCRGCTGTAVRPPPPTVFPTRPSGSWRRPSRRPSAPWPTVFVRSCTCSTTAWRRRSSGAGVPWRWPKASAMSNPASMH